MDAEILIQVVVLGIVQGVAEFLPISSSGHLVIVNWLMSDGLSSAEDDLALNIALHVGTLGSILVVYRRDLFTLLTNIRMLAAIVLATIPVVVIGFTLKDTIEVAFQTPAVAATGLLITAGLLWLSEWVEPPDTPGVSGADDLLEQTVPSWKQAIAIGLFQAIAIVPGISRSGSTIAGGVMSGVSRTLAAQFSFLIAIPAICGATLLHTIDVIKDPTSVAVSPALAVGAIVAFVVGIFALEGLLKLVRQKKLRWFAWYCLSVSALTWTGIVLR